MKGAIFFSDVKGSSKLWSNNGKEMMKMLVLHEKIIRKFAAEYKGLIVKTIGDAVMIYFPTLIGAVSATLKIQSTLKKHPIVFKSGDVLEIRIGIAFGEMDKRLVEIQGVKLKDFFGHTVNLASRMESKVSIPGGFGLLIDEQVPKNVLILIEKHCNIKNIKFDEDCAASSAAGAAVSPAMRSRRLVSFGMPECKDKAILHVEDNQNYECISCVLR